MTKSTHEYRDSEGNVLVSIGDELTPAVVTMLGMSHAVRMPTDAELQAEFDAAEDTKQELIAMIETAQQQIAEATESLREVCNLTDDQYRGSTMVANLEALVGSGSWMALKSETLQGWIEALRDGEEV